MNMQGQRNSTKPKPKLQVYVSQEVADRLRDYASIVGGVRIVCHRNGAAGIPQYGESEIMTKKCNCVGPLRHRL